MCCCCRSDTILLDDKEVKASTLPEGLLLSDNINDDGTNLLRTLRLAVVANHSKRDHCSRRCNARMKQSWLTLCGCPCTCRASSSGAGPDIAHQQSSPISFRDIHSASSSAHPRGCCQDRAVFAAAVEDVESNKELLKRWIFHDDVKLKVMWDILLVLAILVTMIQIPFVIG